GGGGWGGGAGGGGGGAGVSRGARGGGTAGRAAPATATISSCRVIQLSRGGGAGNIHSGRGAGSSSISGPTDDRSRSTMRSTSAPSLIGQVWAPSARLARACGRHRRGGGSV